MIKNFRALHVAKNKTDFQRLTEFFSSLGLEISDQWEAHSNSGRVFLPPEGGMELGLGQGFPQADAICEVANADDAHRAIKKKALARVTDPDDSHGVRIFVASLAGFRCAFYGYLKEARHSSSPSTEAKLDAHGRKFALVVSRFNSFITERLLEGALLALRQSGARRENLRVVRVPGAFEIPSMARTLAASGEYDAIVCLGCLLRGDTLHYDVIANEVTRGIGQSAQETGVPHGFGVLTCDTLEQAIDRAGLKAGNKGAEAAFAAIEMANLTAAAGTKASPERASRISRSPAGRQRKRKHAGKKRSR